MWLPSYIYMVIVAFCTFSLREFCRILRCLLDCLLHLLRLGAAFDDGDGDCLRNVWRNIGEASINQLFPMGLSLTTCVEYCFSQIAFWVKTYIFIRLFWQSNSWAGILLLLFDCYFNCWFWIQNSKIVQLVSRTCMQLLDFSVTHLYCNSKWWKSAKSNKYHSWNLLRELS